MRSTSSTAITSKLIAQAETLRECIESFNADVPSYGNAMAMICLEDVLHWLATSRDQINESD